MAFVVTFVLMSETKQPETGAELLRTVSEMVLR